MMKTLKLAILPATMLATSAFASEMVVVDEVVTNPVAVSTTTYNPENGVIKNTTSQFVEGTKTFFKKATHPAAISAEIGTLGYGGNIAWGVNEKTELVAGWNGGKPSFDVDINIDTNSDDSYINWKKVLNDAGAKQLQSFNGTFKIDGKINNPYLGVNLRPLSNAFTIGTGVIYQDNKIKASLSPNKNSTFPVTYDGKTYTISSDAGLEYNLEDKNSLVPYLTVGFRPNIGKRFGLFGEIGAAYSGGYKSSARVTGNRNVTIKGNGVNTTQSADEIVKELENKLNGELKGNGLKWYPIAKVGATIRF